MELVSLAASIGDSCLSSTRTRSSHCVEKPGSHEPSRLLCAMSACTGGVGMQLQPALSTDSCPVHWQYIKQWHQIVRKAQWQGKAALVVTYNLPCKCSPWICSLAGKNAATPWSNLNTAVRGLFQAHFRHICQAITSNLIGLGSQVHT